MSESQSGTEIMIDFSNNTQNTEHRMKGDVCDGIAVATERKFLRWSVEQRKCRVLTFVFVLER